MNLSLLQTLTWSTVAGAVISALALAATEPDAPPARERSGANGPQEPLLALPGEPTAAGPVSRPAASAPELPATAYAVR